jgi:hypothetical protein
MPQAFINRIKVCDLARVCPCVTSHAASLLNGSSSLLIACCWLTGRIRGALACHLSHPERAGCLDTHLRGA